jgi:hypothetical protein
VQGQKRQLRGIKEKGGWKRNLPKVIILQFLNKWAKLLAWPILKTQTQQKHKIQ